MMTEPSGEILGMGELARRLGISKNLVAQWMRRAKLPEPDWRLEMGPVWRASTIDAWEQTKPEPE
jgi:predicted DNA-binding transcriptional regulator AlpA